MSTSEDAPEPQPLRKTVYMNDVEAVAGDEDKPFMHQRVRCPRSGCDTELRRDALPSHFLRHKGWTLEVTESVQAGRKRLREAANAAAAATQRTVSAFFAPRASAGAAGGGGAAQPPALTAGAAPPALRVEPPAAQQPGAQPSATQPLVPPAEVGPLDAAIAALSAALGSATLLIGQLRAELAALPNRVKAAVVQDAKEELAAAREARVRGTTVAELAENNRLVVTADELQCRPCCEHGRAGLGAGHFSLTLGDGVTQRSIASLRKALAKHFSEKAHKMCVETAERAKVDQKKANAAGMNVGFAAYFGLKEASSYHSFERQLVLMEKTGTNVGTINHSRKLASDLVGSVASVVRNRLRGFFAKPQVVLGDMPPPFCVMADKATLRRETGQTTGVVVFEGGVKKAVLVENRTVSHVAGDGASIAKAIVKALLTVVDKKAVRTRLMGGAFDGAYIKANIGRCLREASGAGPICLAWVS